MASTLAHARASAAASPRPGQPREDTNTGNAGGGGGGGVGPSEAASSWPCLHTSSSRLLPVPAQYPPQFEGPTTSVSSVNLVQNSTAELGQHASTSRPFTPLGEGQGVRQRTTGGCSDGAGSVAAMLRADAALPYLANLLAGSKGRQNAYDAGTVSRLVTSQL